MQFAFPLILLVMAGTAVVIYEEHRNQSKSLSFKNNVSLTQKAPVMTSQLFTIKAYATKYPIRPLNALVQEINLINQVGVSERSIKRIKRCFIVMRNFPASSEHGIQTIAKLDELFPDFIKTLQSELKVI